MPEFHVEAPQATVSEGLAQGPYVAARAGVEPMTLRTKGVDSTSGALRPALQSNGLYACICIMHAINATQADGL